MRGATQRGEDAEDVPFDGGLLLILLLLERRVLVAQQQVFVLILAGHGVVAGGSAVEVKRETSGPACDHHS
jgi:hypothetical protein